MSATPNTGVIWSGVAHAEAVSRQAPCDGGRLRLQQADIVISVKNVIVGKKKLAPRNQFLLVASFAAVRFLS